MVLDALRDAIEGVVDDVFAAVADWDALRATVTDFAGGAAHDLRPTASPRREAEVATYLDWLADDHFTFVGAVAVDASRGRGARLRAGRGAPAARCSTSTTPILADGGCSSRSTWSQRGPPCTATVPLDSVDRAPPAGLTAPRWRAPPARPLHRQRLQRQRRAIPLLRQKVARGASARSAPRARRATTGARSPTCWRSTRATSCSGSTTDELAERRWRIVAMGLRRRRAGSS